MNRPRPQSVMAYVLGAALHVVAVSGHAQQGGTEAAAADAGHVAYPAAFFQPYNPLTARDMVLQVPGFSLDEGGDARGFGGTAGNVLIGGARPSTKNDDAGAILGRIPASQVLRIDLIRGDTGGLNLRGQTVVVDVILRPDALPATRWESRVRTTENTNTLNPWGSISKTGYAGATRYTLGMEGGEDRAHQARGTEWLLVPAGLAEQRQEEANTSGKGYALNLNSETLLGSAVLHVNGRVGTQRLDDFEVSQRLAVLPLFTSRTVEEGRFSDIDTLELGADFELTLSPTFAAKAIAVLNQGRNATQSSLRVLAPTGSFRSASLADRSADNEEWIARLELDWSGWAGHRVELNLEGAWNSLDSTVDLRQDSGQGLRPVPLPGANTLVKEARSELELVDSWQQGPISVEAGLAAEFSTITQSGDARNSRTFEFLKPRLLLTFSPDPVRQYRLRVQRDVAQLNFNDFASTTNFADNQFALGNPGLKPDSTWLAELSAERRFGAIGVANVTAFHHSISDVLDILPLQDNLEVPGNIGDGRRWGLETGLVFPLSALGIAGARVDVRARWQDSAVRDPVTGRTRELSNQARHELRVDFRQNLVGTSWAWGGMVATVSDIPYFGIDEFVANDNIASTVDMDVFIETTRWFGLRTRLQAGNALNRGFLRDRQVYTGARELTPLAFRELRLRTRGHSLEVSVTGSF